MGLCPYCLFTDFGYPQGSTCLGRTILTYFVAANAPSSRIIPGSTDPLNYNPALDGLRGLAALMVVAYHSKLSMVQGGFLGVDLFFVLSGMLITRLLRSELEVSGTMDVARFYWRRLLRLWPPMLVMLLLYACVMPLLIDGVDITSDVPMVMFYLTDYTYPLWRIPELLRHTWSLSVEEHFYLVWPLVILATRKVDARTLAMALFCAYLAATGWRMMDYSLFGDWEWTYFRLDTRLSGLLLGSALGLVRWEPTSEAFGWTGLVLLAILAATMSLPSWFQFSSGTVLAELASAAVVCAAQRRDGLFFRLLSWRPLVFFGLLSYSIYLVHYPIVRVLRDEIDPSTTFAIAMAVSVVIAWAIHILVERPLRRWRNAKPAMA